MFTHPIQMQAQRDMYVHLCIWIPAWFFNLYLGFCLQMQMQAEMQAQVPRQEIKHFPFLASLLAFICEDVVHTCIFFVCIYVDVLFYVNQALVPKRVPY